MILDSMDRFELRGKFAIGNAAVSGGEGVSAPMGAAVGDGLYLVFSLNPRETVILWTDANVIVPRYNSWLMPPSQSSNSGYSPESEPGNG